jgi:hypothetical protein
MATNSAPKGNCWDMQAKQTTCAAQRKQKELYPLLISTGFLKYPVSLDNLSITKFSV